MIDGNLVVDVASVTFPGCNTRVQNCLERMGVRYIGELVQRSELELLKTKYFGRKALGAVKHVLGSHRLSVGSHLDNWPEILSEWNSGNQALFSLPTIAEWTSASHDDLELPNRPGPANALQQFRDALRGVDESAARLRDRLINIEKEMEALASERVGIQEALRKAGTP